jgi:hypothetical protein
MRAKHERLLKGGFIVLLLIGGVETCREKEKREKEAQKGAQRMPVRVNPTFFPKEYKQFKYKPGDLLSCKDKDGYGLVKILKVDRIEVKKGRAINIMGKEFRPPMDDWLLVVSTSFSESTFPSLEALRKAVAEKTWSVEVGCVPRRPPWIGGPDSVLLGNEEVTEEELIGYKEWKASFDAGEAGIF